MKRIIVGLALVSLSAQAETVKAFLDAADRQNVDLRISIEQRNRAAAEYRQAWTGLFPSLSASAGWTHNQYGAGIDVPQKDADGNTIIENGKPLTSRVVIVPVDQFDANFRFELADPQFRNGVGCALGVSRGDEPRTDQRRGEHRR